MIIQATIIIIIIKLNTKDVEFKRFFITLKLKQNLSNVDEILL